MTDQNLSKMEKISITTKLSVITTKNQSSNTSDTSNTSNTFTIFNNLNQTPNKLPEKSDYDNLHLIILCLARLNGNYCDQIKAKDLEIATLLTQKIHLYKTRVITYLLAQLIRLNLLILK
jgi:hypothetical protein